jgi:hypothetical protein
MTPDIISDTLLATDHPIDKVVYMDSGSITVPANSSADATEAHVLSFAPLLDCTWSTDPSFGLSYDIGTGAISASGPFIFDIFTEIYGTNSSAVLTVYNDTGSSKTVYYRMFGYEPSNSNAEVPHTASVADDFVIDTDLNYSKLLYSDRITAGQTITHNLNRRLHVMLWEEILSSGRIYKNNNAEMTDTSKSSAKVNLNNIIFNVATGSAVHYRVYASE